MYRDLGKNRGVFRILAAQLTARFPFGMTSIAMLMHIEHMHGNYTAAGVVLGAASIGQAISGPLTSRWMGAWGMRKVLALTTAVCAVVLSVLALVPMAIPLTMAFAFLMGLSTPPVTPAVRTIYPKLVPSKQVAALFSLDASAQEIIWVLGPVLAVLVSGQVSTTAGLLTAVGFMVVGGIWFMFSPEVGQVRIPRSRRRLGAVLTRPTVVLATILGFLFVASFSALEAGVVSAFPRDGMEPGIVLGIFSIGSIVGGLLFGHRALTPWSLTTRVTIVTLGTAFCLLSLNMWWLSGMLFLAGFGVAPTLAGIFTMVSSTVKFSETAESYGWVGTGQLIGAALGSAIAGVGIDAVGPNGAILASILFLVVCIIAAAIGSRWIPDMRGRDAAPIPDTEPITLPS